MMDKKDIISKLAGYKLEGDIEGREKIIELGYEIVIRLGMSRHSYFELFLSTFRFIHVHTWIIQLFIFGNKILYLFPINNLNVQNILGILYSKDAFFFHSFFINIGFIFIFQFLIRVGMQLYCFIHIKHWKF